VQFNNKYTLLNNISGKIPYLIKNMFQIGYTDYSAVAIPDKKQVERKRVLAIFHPENEKKNMIIYKAQSNEILYDYLDDVFFALSL